MRLERVGVCARARVWVWVWVWVDVCGWVSDGRRQSRMHWVLERSLRVGVQGDWNVATTHTLTPSGAWGSCGFERTSDGRSRVGEKVYSTFNRECATSTRCRANPIPTRLMMSERRLEPEAAGKRNHLEDRAGKVIRSVVPR